MKLRLTLAQVSALECAGLDQPEGPAEVTLAAAWRGRVLEVTDATRDALFEAVNDRSNAEDAQAEQTGDIFARRAARSLSALASAVLRAGRTR